MSLVTMTIDMEINEIKQIFYFDLKSVQFLLAALSDMTLVEHAQ